MSRNTISFALIVQYLEKGTYPNTATTVQKRGIRRRAGQFRLGDDATGRQVLILKADGEYGDRVAVFEDAVKQEILAQYHSSADGGHLGVNNTYGKIISKYYWNNIRDEVHDYVRRCDKCQRVNPSLKAGNQAEIKPIPVKKGPFLQWGIDMVGPLKETPRGNQYILAATCYFSKWTEAVALPSKHATGVAKFLLDLFSRYGGGHVVISDRGREFVNELIESIGGKFQVEHRIAAAYHPQTNGLQERANQTMQKILTKITNEDHNDWDVKLPNYLFASRSMVQSSTGFSPFRIIYGREPTMPVDMELQEASAIDHEISEEVIQAFDNARQLIEDKVATNITASQTKQKEQFAKSLGLVKPLQVGELVLVKNTRKIGRKMNKMSSGSNWMGPKGTGYKIVQVLPNGNCVLEGLKRNYNPSSLRRYVAAKKPASSDTSSRWRFLSGESSCPSSPTSQVSTSPLSQAAANKASSHRRSLSGEASCPSSSTTQASTSTPFQPVPNNTSSHRRSLSGEASSPSRLKTQTSTSPLPKRSASNTSSRWRFLSRDARGRQTTTLSPSSNASSLVEDMPREDLKMLLHQLLKYPLPQLSNPFQFGKATEENPILSFYADVQMKHEHSVVAVGEFLATSKLIPLSIYQNVNLSMLASAVLVEAKEMGLPAQDLLPTLSQVPGVPDAEVTGALQEAVIPEGNAKLCVLNNSVSREDLKSLLPFQWLNDQVINAYLGLITRLTNNAGNKKVYTFPSYLAVKWDDGDFNTWLFPKIHLANYEIVLVPVCTDDHWVLLYANMKTSCITLLDSVPSTQRRQRWHQHWRNFLQARHNAGVEDLLDGWTGVILPTHVQEDGHSCGVFLLMHAHAICRGLIPFVSRQYHVPIFRNYILGCLVGHVERNDELVCELPYCVRRDHKRNKWIQCDECGRWCHWVCASVRRTPRVFKCIICR